MDTRPDERLPYLELARQGARVVRSAQAAGFARLAEIAPACTAVDVELTFSLDDDGRPWVAGVAEGSFAPTCQRCLEQRERPLRVTFELCIVRDSALASELASDVDVLEAETDSVTLADVVEDELILGVPERLCVEQPCPDAPALSYPADAVEDPEPDDHPFAVLSRLKR
jgi:uncharacterized protein